MLVAVATVALLHVLDGPHAAITVEVNASALAAMPNGLPTLPHSAMRASALDAETVADAVAIREHRVPPLLRTARRTAAHSIGGTYPGLTRGDFRSVSEWRNRYEGEYGWAFSAYRSSQLEQDFYRDVAAFEEQANWTELAEQYRARMETLMDAAAARVAPHTPKVFSEDLAHECNIYVRTIQYGEAQEVARGSNATCLGSSEPMDDELLSSFEYVFRCLVPPCSQPPPQGFAVGAKHKSYIEPLVGILRHPRAFLSDTRTDLMNKEYMMPDKWALHHLRTRYQHRIRKSHYFDLGASTYTDGMGGPSQVWFEGLSECLCVPFTMMHLWESTQHDPKSVWRDVPEWLQPRYHWFNQPLNASEASWNNPLNHLLLHVSDDDVLIVKIDFDHPSEADILKTILDTPELYNSIDELFYEHHVMLGPMTEWWGGSGVNRNLKARDSIDLFRSLRMRGVRAHSWV